MIVGISPTRAAVAATIMQQQAMAVNGRGSVGGGVVDSDANSSGKEYVGGRNGDGDVGPNHHHTQQHQQTGQTMAPNMAVVSQQQAHTHTKSPVPLGNMPTSGEATAGSAQHNLHDNSNSTGNHMVPHQPHHTNGYSGFVIHQPPPYPTQNPADAGPTTIDMVTNSNMMGSNHSGSQNNMPPSSSGAVLHQGSYHRNGEDETENQTPSNSVVTDNEGSATEMEEDPLKLFVGQVPKQMGEEDIFPTFDAFGPLKDVAIIRDKNTGLHRGCAFVTYWSALDAQRAQQALHDNFTFPGARRPAQVKPAEPSVPENKLFIGMLSRTAGEEDVRELFQRFGEIREIHMIRLSDGTSRCAAFLRFVKRESAQKAIEEMNNSIVMEGAARPLIVKFADNKHQRQQRQLRNIRKQEMMSVAAAVPPHYPPQAYPGAAAQIQIAPPNTPGAAPAPYHHPSIPSHHQFAAPHYAGAHPYMYPHAYLQPAYGPPPHHHQIAVQQQQQHVQPQLPDGGANSSNPRPREGPAGANLFVYHLPHDLTDADLATAFNSFGNVISAKVYVDKFTGESKGFGFVSYDSVISAEAAIEQMNGFQIGNKRLKVQHKRVHGMNPNLPVHRSNPHAPPPPARQSPAPASDDPTSTS